MCAAKPGSTSTLFEVAGRPQGNQDNGGAENQASAPRQNHRPGRQLRLRLARLESLPDFQCTMTWSFDSWIPLLGRMLPSDTYSIFKRGSSLRLDTTLLGMTGLRWERAL